MAREAEESRPRTRSKGRKAHGVCFAVADVPGWGVYDTWEEVRRLGTERYKKFADVRVAWEWLETQDEPAALSSSGRGRFKYYAVAQTLGWGIYTKWRTVKQMRPKRFKGFNNLRLAREWLEKVDANPERAGPQTKNQVTPAEEEGENVVCGRGRTAPGSVPFMAGMQRTGVGRG